MNFIFNELPQYNKFVTCYKLKLQIGKFIVGDSRCFDKHTLRHNLLDVEYMVAVQLLESLLKNLKDSKSKILNQKGSD